MRADTVLVRDPAAEERLARLELRVLERDAQIEELQAQLAAAREEVVRTMAKLQSTATRAEAASALAEAEVAVQGLRSAGGASAAADPTQARVLLAMSSTEFNNQNYAGALYLANQAKAQVSLARTRLAAADLAGGPVLPGETVFAVPVKLQSTARANVREGPRRDAPVLYTVERGAALTGHSYLDGWVRVAADGGRSGWVHQSLVSRRDAGRP
jgi:uncharacterized coiled-coil protein SlyX